MADLPGQAEVAADPYRAALLRLVGASSPGMRLGLESTRQLLARLGDPQLSLRGVLVAGTNGKGSVCAIVAEIAERAGIRVALLTKPHLTTYRERIRLNGEPVEKNLFQEIADAVSGAADQMASAEGRPTHHELLTAMGFLAAQRWSAELVVCEVGLGGRLDATNVWDGGIAALTSVALDHQAQLGNTIPEIAREKAAIIKPGNLVVSGAPDAARPAVEAAAVRASARLWQLGREINVELAPDGGHGLMIRTPLAVREELLLGLSGSFQAENAALAVGIADSLVQLGFPISDLAIRSGLAGVHWPGRMETLGSVPEVLIDAAHNPAAVDAVLPEIRRQLSGRSGVLLFGSMEDHDHQGMLQLLRTVGFQAAVFTRSSSARAAAGSTLAACWSAPFEVVEPVSQALVRARALAGPDGLVVSLGSIYVIGEVMSALGVGIPPDPEIPFPPLW
ncbi:MAG TPA: Mur ligase family protein [Candidatus Dormibacteraeota bacterium]|nr:Mur ligase family protein [Candidatus Dormibacteraeota bacterium]